jgi:hypothetical protein
VFSKNNSLEPAFAPGCSVVPILIIFLKVRKGGEIGKSNGVNLIKKYIICMYGNITVKPLIELIYTNFKTWANFIFMTSSPLKKILLKYLLREVLAQVFCPFYFFVFFAVLGLELGLHLEPLHQPFFMIVFF